MPIPLNNSIDTRPSAKLPTIGSGIELCMIGSRQVPWTEYGTGQPRIGQNGKPRKQLRITGIVVSHSGAMSGPMGNDRPVEVGEVMDVYLSGGNWGSYIDGEKAFRTAGMSPQVGDILLWVYRGDVPSRQPGGQPHKDRASTIRRARPDEQGWVAQAEAQYYLLGFDKADADAGPPDTTDDGPFPASQQYPPQQPYTGQQPQQPQQPQYPPYGQQIAPQQPYPAQQPQPYPAQQPSYPPRQPGDPGF